jgi:hypothetical protein
MAKDERSQKGKARRGPGWGNTGGGAEPVACGDGVIPNPKAKRSDQLREVLRLKRYSFRSTLLRGPGRVDSS